MKSNWQTYVYYDDKYLFSENCLQGKGVEASSWGWFDDACILKNAMNFNPCRIYIHVADTQVNGCNE